MSKILVLANFTKLAGEPATGLTLSEIALYLVRRTRSDGTMTTIWDGTQNPTIEVTYMGMYGREYASADETLYDYFARASYTGLTALDVDHVVGSVRQSELAKSLDDFQSEVLAQTTLAGRVYQLWARWFNLTTQTATSQKVYKADSVTILGQTSVSDDGVTQVRGKLS